MVKIISDIGYCYGVEHAIEVLRETRGKVGHVYLTHPLIHNKSENIQLMEENNASILKEKIPGKNEGILFSAHGHSKEEEEKYKGKTNLFDATCPLILSRYRAIEKKKNDNILFFFLGKRNHQETIGFLSNFRFLHFIDSEIDLRSQFKAYSDTEEYALIPQTTISMEKYTQAVNLLKEKGNLVYTLDICQIYYRRVKQSIDYLKNIDSKKSACIVMGDVSSSNARELKKAIQDSYPDLFVQIALSIDDLEMDKIKEKNIYLTSATSCPKEKVLRMKAILDNLSTCS